MLENAAAILCGDDELAYRDSRTPFVDGEGLLLDESYRLAHLPLVVPDHPRVIARRAGKSYDRGRHDPEYRPPLSSGLSGKALRHRHVRRLQQIVGCRETRLYVVGLYNLVDDLDAAEAAALARLIDRWWDRPIARFHVPALWSLAAYDDLVLNAEIVETIPLG